MTQVSSVNQNNVNVSNFVTKTKKTKNQYIGTITGASVAAVSVGANVGLQLITKTFKFSSLFKSIAKSIPLFAGAGFVVDYLNNQQRQKSKPNAVTDKNNLYTKVDNGKKYGALLGLAAGVISGLLNFKNLATFKQFGIVGKSVTTVLSLGISALGGHLLGMATDNITNAQDAKHVDKKGSPKCLS